MPIGTITISLGTLERVSAENGGLVYTFQRGLPDRAVKGIVHQVNVAVPGNPVWDSVAAGNAAIADACSGPSPVRWVNNYYVSPDPFGQGYVLPAGCDFIPTIYGDVGCPFGSEFSSANLAAAVANSTTGELITFQEPNNATPPIGTNMTVARVVALWPQIRATGLRIGAPGMQVRIGQPIPTWFSDFVTALGSPDFDFIPVHLYGEVLTDAGGEINRFLTYIQSMHNTYNKPIWIREYGFIAFGALPSHPTDAQMMGWYGGTAGGLFRTLPWIERYAAFHSGPGKDSTASQFFNDGLYNTDGTVTPVGTYYKGLPLVG